MVDKSQSFRRGREFTHELVVLKKSQSSSSFNSLVDDGKYTSLKPIRSQTVGNYEQPISTLKREEWSANVAALSVDKRQSPTEEIKDVELEPPKKLSLKIAKCTRHAYVTIITTVVLGILLFVTLVLAVLALSLAKAGTDHDMLQLMTKQMVEKVRTELSESVTRLEGNLTQLVADFQTELNESVTQLEGNLTQLVADFQGQSKESAARLQELNTTLRHEFTSKITTLNRADETIRGNIKTLSQTHGERLDLVKSELDQRISSLNASITSSKYKIGSLQVQINENKEELNNLRGTVTAHNSSSNTSFRSIDNTLTNIQREVQTLKITCNCP